MSAQFGRRPPGTDGNDFNHRQKIAPQYQTSVLNKPRLKFTMILHVLLALIMLVKFSQDICDRLDIFVMELEEFEIPRPLTWEWVWFFSVLFTYVGYTGIRRNKVSNLQLYFAGILVFSVGSSIYGLALWAPDFYYFIRNGYTDETEIWLDYSLAKIWYIFLAVCLQVHIFSLIFTYQLLLTWKISTRKTE